MTERTALIQQLSEQLAQEETFLRQFYDVLLEEHDALSEHDRIHLEQVVHNKQSLLDQFQQAINKRMETLRQLGMSEEATPDVIDEFFKGCSSDIPEIMESWNTLQTLLTDCKEKNAANGAIIEVSTHSVQTALSILHGKAGSTDLYDAKGNTKPGDGSGNSLAKA